MRKSQIVFDEIGYNVSQEVKDLIYSIDDEGAFGSSDEALQAQVSDLASELAETKAHNAELREVVIAKLENDLDLAKTRILELEDELAKAANLNADVRGLDDDRR